MNERQSRSLTSWTPGFGQEQFPGIEETFSGPPAAINTTTTATTVLPAEVVEAAPAKGGLPFNLSNLSDLKSMVDRMGGIDGVLATMGKVQKFMSTLQQVAPMIKLFMGKKGKAAAADKSKGTPERRRPVRRRTNNKSRTRKTSYKRR
ncbi:tyrosine protein kinase [Cohnella cholangitidis]|uniref:tyrosine protein kinase n=1 Tax=Cohnella cholangitidis TaxID=2598458 RepID=UPI0015F93A53|nr:tyrosine protein kinase [Cohnella cholangitidis]